MSELTKDELIILLFADHEDGGLFRNDNADTQKMIQDGFLTRKAHKEGCNYQRLCLTDKGVETLVEMEMP